MFLFHRPLFIESSKSESDKPSGLNDPPEKELLERLSFNIASHLNHLFGGIPPGGIPGWTIVRIDDACREPTPCLHTDDVRFDRQKGGIDREGHGQGVVKITTGEFFIVVVEGHVLL